jgi:hypothetical protein
MLEKLFRPNSTADISNSVKGIGPKLGGRTLGPGGDSKTASKNFSAPSANRPPNEIFFVPRATVTKFGWEEDATLANLSAISDFRPGPRFGRNRRNGDFLGRFRRPISRPPEVGSVRNFGFGVVKIARVFWLCRKNLADADGRIAELPNIRK